MAGKTNWEIASDLKEKLRGFIASPFWIDIEHGTSVMSIAVGRSRKAGANSDMEPENWYWEFAKAVASKYGASFRTAIEDEGALVYDGFFWDIEELAAEEVFKTCTAAIKDFMTGVSAVKRIDVDEAVTALKLNAALAAAVIPNIGAKRRDRGDNL